ncbi:hypothetical protein [Methylocapsa acidiphila]|uniref:hypothetical protein n=1 Tax=Methylocapsa acidiphila TaxID=133552 RepID=UPI0012EB8B10|nr:hypothetical protein [Methylocapsa acidiphila]
MDNNVFLSFIRKLWPQAFAGAMMAAPDYLHFSHGVAAWIFWIGGVVGLIGLLLEVRSESGNVYLHDRKKLLIFLTPIIVGATILCGAGWYFWPSAYKLENIAADSAKDTLKPKITTKTGEDIFNNAFNTNGENIIEEGTATKTIINNGILIEIQIPYKVIFNIQSKTYFFAAFIGSYLPAFQFISDISTYAEPFATDAANKGVLSAIKEKGKEAIILPEFKFSKKVIIYYEEDLSIQDIAKLDDIFTKIGLHLELRGTSRMMREGMGE